MKKALLIFLTLAMLLSLCACRTPEEERDTPNLENGVVVYGSRQSGLTAEALSLFRALINNSQWTPGETKTVRPYKITLDGLELEYASTGVLYDATNDRYVKVMEDQKNEINAVLEQLIGTVDEQLPPQ